MGFRGVNSVLRWGIAALLILGFALPALSSEAPVVTVDVHAARKLVRSDHKYLDVRTVEEFKKGHPESSFNVPYLFFTPDGRVKNPSFVEQVAAVCNKDDHIVVGCLSGVRSLQATSDLLKAENSNLGRNSKKFLTAEICFTPKLLRPRFKRSNEI